MGRPPQGGPYTSAAPWSPPAPPLRAVVGCAAALSANSPLDLQAQQQTHAPPCLPTLPRRPAANGRATASARPTSCRPDVGAAPRLPCPRLHSRPASGVLHQIPHLPVSSHSCSSRCPRPRPWRDALRAPLELAARRRPAQTCVACAHCREHVQTPSLEIQGQTQRFCQQVPGGGACMQGGGGGVAHACPRPAAIALLPRCLAAAAGCQGRDGAAHNRAVWCSPPKVLQVRTPGQI